MIQQNLNFDFYKNFNIPIKYLNITLEEFFSNLTDSHKSLYGYYLIFSDKENWKTNRVSSLYLCGNAGTGKTTYVILLLKYFIDTFKGNGYYINFSNLLREFEKLRENLNSFISNLSSIPLLIIDNFLEDPLFDKNFSFFISNLENIIKNRIDNNLVTFYVSKININQIPPEKFYSLLSLLKESILFININEKDFRNIIYNNRKDYFNEFCKQI